MNVVTRGTKNALRSPIRSGAIVIMLSISVALILVMLSARSSVTAQIDQVKTTTATTIDISPAGIQGGMGGGDPLTADQVTTITNTEHVTGVVSTLTDQMGTDDTDLTPSTELGSFGERQQRFEGSGMPSFPMPEGEAGDGATAIRTPPAARTTVTGTSDPNSVATEGGELTLKSGATIDGNSDELIALVGTSLAAKNNLSVGSTFTAYGQTITVKGVYETGNNFADNGVVMPLATVQNLTDQAGKVISATVSVDSSENVEATATALESMLGDKADVTSASERAAESLTSLESIESLTLVGVVGAAGTGAVIVLMAMIMIVRERRREIGVIKALGGNNFKVITQFIVESVTLTFIGAVLGMAIGIFASGPLTSALVSTSSSSTTSTTNQMPGGGNPGGMRAMGAGGPRGIAQEAQSNLDQITATLSPAVFAGAIGITFLIAIIGSAIPAWLIARVRPAEVLRSE